MFSTCKSLGHATTFSCLNQSVIVPPVLKSGHSLHTVHQWTKYGHSLLYCNVNFICHTSSDVPLGPMMASISPALAIPEMRLRIVLSLIVTVTSQKTIVLPSLGWSTLPYDNDFCLSLKARY